MAPGNSEHWRASRQWHPVLRDAHAKLDRAVDRCYRAQPFPDERRRFEYLFAMWERLERPLAAGKKKGMRRAKKG